MPAGVGKCVAQPPPNLFCRRPRTVKAAMEPRILPPAAPLSPHTAYLLEYGSGCSFCNRASPAGVCPLANLTPATLSQYYGDFRHHAPSTDALAFWRSCFYHAADCAMEDSGLHTGPLAFPVDIIVINFLRDRLLPRGLRTVCAALVSRGDLIVARSDGSIAFSEPRGLIAAHAQKLVGALFSLASSLSSSAMSGIDALLSGSFADVESQHSHAAQLPPGSVCVLAHRLEDYAKRVHSFVLSRPAHEHTLLLVHPTYTGPGAAATTSDGVSTSATLMAAAQIVSLPQCIEASGSPLNHLLLRSRAAHPAHATTPAQLHPDALRYLVPYLTHSGAARLVSCGPGRGEALRFLTPMGVQLLVNSSSSSIASTSTDPWTGLSDDDAVCVLKMRVLESKLKWEAALWATLSAKALAEARASKLAGLDALAKSQLRRSLAAKRALELRVGMHEKVQTLLHSLTDSLETRSLVSLLAEGTNTLRRSNSALHAQSDSVADVLDALSDAVGASEDDVEALIGRFADAGLQDSRSLTEQLDAAFADAELQDSRSSTEHLDVALSEVGVSSSLSSSVTVMTPSKAHASATKAPSSVEVLPALPASVPLGVNAPAAPSVPSAAAPRQPTAAAAVPSPLHAAPRALAHAC